MIVTVRSEASEDVCMKWRSMFKHAMMIGGSEKNWVLSLHFALPDSRRHPWIAIKQSVSGPDLLFGVSPAKHQTHLQALIKQMSTALILVLNPSSNLRNSVLPVLEST